MKTAQALDDSNVLLRGITNTNKKKQKQKKTGGFLGMLLGTLGASLLGNMLTVKGVLRAAYKKKERKGALRTGYENKQEKGVLRPGYGSKDF